jgi:cation diffusion facilitator CzcD-associated flavoprotein CzcO
MNDTSEVVAVGAGQAGLAVSRELTRVGDSYAVLEEGPRGADMAWPLGQLFVSSRAGALSAAPRG